MGSFEHAPVRRFVMVFAATAFVLMLLPASVEAAGPALMRLVDGDGASRVQIDGGKLRVGDGSGALTVNGTVQARLPRTRHGSRTLELSGGYPRSFDLPRNVVLTDVVITRWSTSNASTCAVWLFEIEDGGMGPIHTLKPTSANPVAELHLESGIAPTADRFGFFVNSDCIVDILWTGHLVN